MYAHTSCGILMNAVLTFNIKVKRMIETEREPITTNARRRFTPLPLPSSEPPTTTGRSGSMQGASTVRIPAKNAMSSSDII